MTETAAGGGRTRTAEAEILGAFHGRIEPVRVSLLYRLGLFLVAVAMALLPLVYLGLIALAACGVGYHAIAHTGILAGGAGWSWRLVAYLGPIVAGGILIFFMVKPIFARRGREWPGQPLSRAEHPLFFAFLERICRQVGAPLPAWVDANCEVNAAAGFRRGLLSFAGRDLALTVGLPLVAGLTMRQLAGVLAHELGHFAQSSGMRLSYVIRQVNHWFASMVYERHALDEWMEGGPEEGTDPRLAIVLVLAGLLVALTRKILWLPMTVGNAISCFMSREMEYDADRYAARVAGSETFEATARRFLTLHVAVHGAMADLGESWKQRRLTDNFPALVLVKVEQIRPEAMATIGGTQAEAKTAFFDTHPSEAARIRNARAEGAPGVFQLDRPATDLFADYEALARDATLGYYQALLGSLVLPENIISKQTLLAEQEAVEETDQAQARYFQNVLPPLYPLVGPRTALAPPEDPAALAQALREARQRVERGLPQARQAAARLTEMIQAGALSETDPFFHHEAFALASAESSAAEAETRSTRARLDAALADIDAFAADSRERLLAALRLLGAPETAGRLENAARLKNEAAALLRVLGPLVEVRAPMSDLQREGSRFATLLPALERDSERTEVLAKANALRATLWTLLVALGDRLRQIPNPFETARGRVTLDEYALGQIPGRHDASGLMRKCEEAVTKLCGLYYRLLGRLAAIAEQVEKTIGLDPLPPPPGAEECGKGMGAKE